MATTLYRIIKYGVQAFFRNKWLTIATVSVMMMALFVFLSLIIFNVLTNNALLILRDKIDISVYFQSTVKEDDILNLKRSLESLKEVKSVEYVSRTEALAAFKERHISDETISKALSVLDENPLLASLNIKANDPQDYPIISAYLDNDNMKELVDQVTYNENQIVINRLASIVQTAKKTGIALTSLLSLIAVLVTLNTIILSIYSTRDEISIMRLVGAGNKFIRGPYIVQGILYGISAAIIGMVIMLPLVILASPYVEVLMPEMNLQSYFYNNALILLGYQLLLGISLGVVSSIIAVSKYLKI